MARPLPSLNALHAFEAAARLEGATRAAGELHVTHGAVSRHIRSLEADLGVALFVREGRGLALTPAGRRLRDGATAAFGQLRACCDELRRETRQTPLVLGCSGSVLARWAIPRLDRLTRDLPSLDVHLAVTEAVPAPAMPGLGAALLIAEPPWPKSWQVHSLARESIGPVLSPRHPRFAALRKASLAALRKEALLRTSSRPQAWPAWARAQHVAIDRLHFGQCFEHLYFLLEAAVAGLGVAIAPRQLVADDLAAGRLVAPWGFQATRASWVLCAPKTSSDPRLAALASWLQRQLDAA